MKQKNSKKLQLGKLTIENLQTNLDRDEQKTVRGGSNTTPGGPSEPPIFCV